MYLHSRFCASLILLVVSYISGSSAEELPASGVQPVFEHADRAQIPLHGSSDTLTKRVAIIGAGAAGSSAAYHLRRYAEESGLKLDIDVFERNSYVGGRSTTVYAFDDDELPIKHESKETASDSTTRQMPLELGASIFVSVNRILMDAVKEFDLGIAGDDSGREVLGVWNGDRMVYTQSLGGSSWESWWNNLKLLWRYKLAPIRTVNLMKETVNKFLKMYEQPVFPWREGLTEAANAVGLLDTTDLIQASTRVNYAQNLAAIHGLEAMVCMATDGAMSVAGGNWQIFESMINSSNAVLHLETPITRIETNLETGKASLFASEEKFPEFDSVILATPYHQANIEFGTPPAHVPDNIDYVELHVTLFSSPHGLSPSAFGFEPNEKAPELILTTLPEDELSHGPTERKAAGRAGFFSISKLGTASNPYIEPPRVENLYKIFSPERVTPSFFQQILGLNASSSAGVEDDGILESHVPWVYRKIWKSYPYLPPRITFEPHLLDRNTWYTSGIESFISTMETSSLSGKNVARLIVDEWLGSAQVETK